MRKPIYSIREQQRCRSASAFVVRCLDRIVPVLAIAKISTPLLVSSAEQASLSLNWSRITDRFSHDVQF